MRYQGSKKKMIKILKTLIENNLCLGDVYYEPFAGGMNVISEIEWDKKIANDKNGYIISLWKDIQTGQFKLWNLCRNLTKEQYNEIKKLYQKDETFRKKYASLIGYIGTSCSYGGGWWAGYANYNPRKNENHILEAYNGIQKQIENFKGLSKKQTTFHNKDYNKVRLPKNKSILIYCDPPYSNTRKYKDDFNSEKFWEWATSEVKKGRKVIVSEFTAPSDWKCIWSKSMQDGMNSDGKKRKEEKIFIHESEFERLNIEKVND